VSNLPINSLAPLLAYLDSKAVYSTKSRICQVQGPGTLGCEICMKDLAGRLKGWR
jgi:hypothetical protein